MRRAIKEKGESIIINAAPPLFVVLRAESPMELALLYYSKEGDMGAIHPALNGLSEERGARHAFPYIKLSPSLDQTEKTIEIARLDELQAVEIYIGTPKKQGPLNKACNVSLLSKDHAVKFIPPPLLPDQWMQVARIDINGNAIVAAARYEPLDFTAFNRILRHSQPPRIARKVVLKEKGARATIPVSSLRVSLRWRTAVDLDLHCFFRVKDAYSEQASNGFLSQWGLHDREGHVFYAYRGNPDVFPWIYLDQDAGVGDVPGEHVENLLVRRPDCMEHILIVANIYNKPDACFANYRAIARVSTEYHDFDVPLAESKPGSYCIIAHIDGTRETDAARLTRIDRVQAAEPTINKFLQTIPPHPQHAKA